MKKLSADDKALALQVITERALALKDKARNSRETKILDATACETLFLEEFEKIGQKIFKNKFTPPKYKNKAKKPIKRVLNLMLSDLHYGADLDGREVPHQYGKVEEARRTAYIVKQTVNYKRDYRKDTALYVYIIGDVIQNCLHDMRDGAPLAEQVHRAMYLLTCAINVFSHEFGDVKVFFATGNHGRNTARHHNRATLQKWDSIETHVYLGVVNAFHNHKNVSFEIPMTPYVSVNVFGKKAFFTHGDGVFRPGNPHKSLNVADIQTQINKINSAQSKTGSPVYELVGCGHVHIGTQALLPNGSVFLSNGALIPPDPYSVSLGSLESTCGQWLWESTEEYILGDSRFVTVNEQVDKDSSLDSIIKPISRVL